MAKKKTQVPRPPRPVQAPMKRTAAPVRRAGASGMPMWMWGAGAAVVVAVIAGVALSVGGGTNTADAAGVKAAMVAAGCSYKDVNPLPPRVNPVNYHQDVPTLSTPTTGLWSTSPPSGGAHYGLWAVWGFYLTPVNPRQVVHNEEHGAVVLWWGPNVSQTTISELQAFYNQQTDGVFGTPYSKLGSKIALTSWTGNPADYYRKINGKYYYGTGHIAICSHFNQKAFAKFRDAFRGKGPEGIPLSDDQEGCGPDTACP